MVLRVAVIGGGPAGLATLKHLLEAHKFFPGATIEARLFEAQQDIGGVFKHRVYEDAELVSSKYLTTFSDLRLPKHEPDFVSPERYVEYLEEYARKFGLVDHIQCSSTVVSVRPHPTQPGHLVNIQKSGHVASDDVQGAVHYHAVAICSGLNQTPLIPDIDGLAGLRTQMNHEDDDNEDQNEHLVKIMHSNSFKSRAQFGEGKTVLILGAGETAMDIAHLAVTSPTKRVIMCHRDGFIHAPKIVPQPYRAGGKSGGPDPDHPNKPLDCAIASLFDTAYAPPALQRGPLLWAAYDAFIKNMAWVISGTRAGFDQWAGGISKDRLHADAVMFAKSDRAMPYISEQYRSRSKFNEWRTWLINMELKPTGGKKIDLATWPTHFDENGVVHFVENDRPESKKMAMEKNIKPDIIVFATGYKQSFPFLPQDDDRYPSLDEAETRGIYRSIGDGIAYIGFVRPSFGAVPPLAELQAQRWVLDLVSSYEFRPYFSKTLQPPRRSPHALDGYELDYKLHCRDKDHNFARTKRGVDQEAYAYQLAVDMGAAPSWQYVWFKLGPEVFFTWAMGPNFVTKFRLVGPWSNPAVAEEAAATMRKDGELGKIVRKTGGGVFFLTYTVIPLMLFAPISLLIHLLAWIWEGIRNLEPSSDLAAKPLSGIAKRANGKAKR